MWLGPPLQEVTRLHFQTVIHSSLSLFCLTLSLPSLYLSAHRVVLAAGGDYFRALLCGGLRESSEDVVCLRGVASWVIESILGFIYTGQLALGWGHIWELTDALFQFQLQGALSLCLDFLRGRMDESTCLDVLILAETYGLVQLGQAAEEYILAHFECISAGEKFKDVPCYLLDKFLDKDSICVESEVIFLFLLVDSFVSQLLFQMQKWLYDLRVFTVKHKKKTHTQLHLQATGMNKNVLLYNFHNGVFNFTITLIPVVWQIDLRKFRT